MIEKTFDVRYSFCPQTPSSAFKNQVNREAPLSFLGIDLALQECEMLLEMSKGPTAGEISDISDELLDHFVKIAYPVGILLTFTAIDIIAHITHM